MFYFAATGICFERAEECRLSWEGVGALSGWVTCIAAILVVWVPHLLRARDQRLAVSRDLGEFRLALENITDELGNHHHLRQAFIVEDLVGSLPKRFFENQRIALVVPAVPITHSYDELYRAVHSVVNAANSWNRVLDAMPSGDGPEAIALARQYEVPLQVVGAKLKSSIAAALALIDAEFGSKSTKTY